MRNKHRRLFTSRKKNEITNEERDNVPLRFYAKRAKLMAAFQKFAYQKNELDYTNNVHLKEAATHFANILLRYDFWKSCEGLVPNRSHLSRIRETAS
jgi:hypothetical protein